MTVELLRNAEKAKTQKTGILHAFNPKTKEWCILSDGWERFIFTADMCDSKKGVNWEILFSGLVKGDVVSFTPWEWAEYDIAKKVDFISHINVESLTTQVKDNFAVSMESLETMWIQESGTIKVLRIKEDNGFGFINTDDWKDIFFHSTKCVGGFRKFMDIYKKRKKGDKNIRVTFNVLNSQRGPMAFNVSIAK